MFLHVASFHKQFVQATLRIRPKTSSNLLRRTRFGGLLAAKDGLKTRKGQIIDWFGR